MNEYEFYLVEKKPPIAWVYMNRPHKKNAMNHPAWTESVPIFEDIEEDSDIRVVILSGKGSCFSSGIDLIDIVSTVPEMIQSDQLGAVKWSFKKKIGQLQDAVTCMQRCTKPVIGAIHGHCVGAGLDFAVGCDIRLCSEDAIFSLRESAVGIVADAGVLQRIPLIVGQGIARELAFTAKNFGAERAKEILLVNEVYKDHESLLKGAEQMAMEIADNSPLAVQASKDVLNYGIGKSIEDSLNYVASMSANIHPSNDLFEAVKAFPEKRKPKFTGK
ncbi:MAG: enoyl-CoA hydratase [Desulfobacteraceae bacterium]|nr:enoyl-CoA hydratase [Desulfobacteraceae bacterium]